MRYPDTFEPFRPLIPVSDASRVGSRPDLDSSPFRLMNEHEVLSSGTDLVSSSADCIPWFDTSHLAERLRPSDRILIAVTDATRPSPDRQLLKRIYAELDRGSVPRSNITILCATGLHRPMQQEEMLARLGAEQLEGVRFINHDARNREELVDLGEVEGIPLILNRHLCEADILLATGIVEPHQYAGYSGGGKTIVIGCGGEETIRETHGIGMLDRTGVELGSVHGNPFQEFVRKGAARAGLTAVLNVLLDADGTVVAAAGGGHVEVHNYLAGLGATLYEKYIPEKADAALIYIPPSKGRNLYQASRGATYLALGNSPVLRPGGPIILVADLEEGAGEGTGEQRFHEFLSQASSPPSLIEQMRREGFPAGAQRAYMVAQTLVNHPVIIAGRSSREIVESCGMEWRPTVKDALMLAEAIVARNRTAVRENSSAPSLLLLDNGLATLPRLRNTIL